MMELEARKLLWLHIRKDERTGGRCKNEEAQSLVLEGVGNTYNEYLKILDKDEAK